jgi:hypothetical protein
MNRLTIVVLLAVLLLASCGPQDDAKPAPPASSEPPPPVSAPTPGTAPAGFDKTLALHGISFRVTCPNDSSLNEVTISPSGLEIDNTPVVREADGTVVGAEIADLNLDRSPEIYVYVQSAGSGSYGSLVAFAANNRKSLSEIYLATVADNPKASTGYRGHDEFSVVEGTLVQRFPIYREGDSNAQPSGKTRQLQYKLKPGESGWVLEVEKVIEF